MKHHTNDEIKEFILSLIKVVGNPWIYCVKFVFIKNDEKECLFEVTGMYESPLNFNLKTLKKLSEFFETDNIDIYNDISIQGCSTCDYGSSYGHAIRIWK